MTLAEPQPPTGPSPEPADPGTGWAESPRQAPGTGAQGRAEAWPDAQSRARQTGRAGGHRISIGVKLGALTGALVAVLLVCSLLLIDQTRDTADRYDALLAGQVRQSLLARQMQVEFKKQVQEWKDILLRGSDPQDLATYTANFRSEDAKVNALSATLLSAAASDPRLSAQVASFREAHQKLDQDYAQALTVFKEGQGKDPKLADRMVRGEDRAPTELVDGIVNGLETSLAQSVAANKANIEERRRLTLIVVAVILVIVVALLVLALTRVVRPIRQLTRQAYYTAAERLPAAISALTTMDPGAPPPTLPPFVVHTRDELHELGDALTSLQDSALERAVQQHRADRETAGMLVNLGRRNQNLLGRMLSYVTELERKEQDPDVLSQLFRLDHAATRVRRNAESMLVLAGATQTRTWSRPVPVVDVVRAALSEVEDYVRVDLHHVEDGEITGTAVADIVHLLAELVENATHFSPPTTQVTVIGQLVREGYRLRVIDQGVGMTRRELEEANARIQRSDAGWADAKLLGLLVVGRLARRRGIKVRLEPSAGHGITATVLVPSSLLAGASAVRPVAGESAASDPESEPAVEPGTEPATKPGGKPGGKPRAKPASPPAAKLAGSPPDAPTVAPSISLPEVAVPIPAPAASSAEPLWPQAIPTSASSVTPRVPAPTSPGTGLPTRSRAAAAPARPVEPAVLPRRVRGAQLPDLGPIGDPAPSPVLKGRPQEGPGAAESLRWQLRSFQLDVDAARRRIDESRSASAGDPDVGSDETNHDHHAEGE